MCEHLLEATADWTRETLAEHGAGDERVVTACTPAKKTVPEQRVREEWNEESNTGAICFVGGKVRF